MSGLEKEGMKEKSGKMVIEIY
jgi:hypothetical protein